MANMVILRFEGMFMKVVPFLKFNDVHLNLLDHVLLPDPANLDFQKSSQSPTIITAITIITIIVTTIIMIIITR